MIPDIAVGRPVISNLAAIFTTPVNFAGSAPEYCPPIDEIDAEIERVDLALQKGRYCNQKQYEQTQYPPCKCSPPCPQRLLKKPNFRPSDSIVTKALELYSDLSDILDENTSCGPSMTRTGTSNVLERPLKSPDTFSKTKAQAKQKKPTSLRAALRASGFKPETAENSAEKPAEKEVAKGEQSKCSKSKHQGNAKTFKRKTKRSGRI